jgi:TMEM175 potassium channel family protein
MNKDLPDTGRIEAFSDGVIAIIITIMVLDLKSPEKTITGGLSGLLVPLLPKLIIYLLSFAVIAIIWVRHHSLLHVARHATRPLLWSNIHLLLWMSIIPVTTGLLGQHLFSPLAVAIYGFVLAATAAAFLLLRYSIYRDTRADADLSEYHVTMMRNNVFAILLYALSVPFAFLSVYLSFAIFVLMPGLFFLPEMVERKTIWHHHGKSRR